MKGKMRASSASLTGWLSLRGDEDEPSVRACVCLCVHGQCSLVCLHSHDSLFLSLSAPNGAAGGTALYYLSGPRQWRGHHSLSARAQMRTSVSVHGPLSASLSCGVACQHNKKETSGNTSPQRRPVIGNASSSR